MRRCDAGSVKQPQARNPLRVACSTLGSNETTHRVSAQVDAVQAQGGQELEQTFHLVGHAIAGCRIPARVAETGQVGISDENHKALAVWNAALVDFSPGQVRDVTGRYGQWLEQLGCEAVFVRPDFYVQGGARNGAELNTLLDAWRRQVAAGVGEIFVDGSAAESVMVSSPSALSGRTTPVQAPLNLAQVPGVRVSEQ